MKENKKIKQIAKRIKKSESSKDNRKSSKVHHVELPSKIKDKILKSKKEIKKIEQSKQKKVRIVKQIPVQQSQEGKEEPSQPEPARIIEQKPEIPPLPSGSKPKRKRGILPFDW